MAPKVHLITLGCQLLALLCWAVMFLAGTDNAFYLLFGVLAAQVVATVVAIIRTRGSERSGT